MSVATAGKPVLASLSHTAQGNSLHTHLSISTTFSTWQGPATTSNDLDCFLLAPVHGDIVLYCVAFVEAAESFALEVTAVDKHIVAAVVWRNEAKASAVVPTQTNSRFCHSVN